MTIEGSFGVKCFVTFIICLRRSCKWKIIIQLFNVKEAPITETRDSSNPGVSIRQLLYKYIDTCILYGINKEENSAQNAINSDLFPILQSTDLHKYDRSLDSSNFLLHYMAHHLAPGHSLDTISRRKKCHADVTALNINMFFL